MVSSVIFPLYAKDGIVSPTQTGSRLSALFYDSATGEFRGKQGRNFDGGWRWFHSYEGDVFTIYNVKLEPTAYADITMQEIVDSKNAENTLLAAQGRCLVEHAYISARFAMHTALKSFVNKTYRELGIRVLKTYTYSY